MCQYIQGQAPGVSGVAPAAQLHLHHCTWPVTVQHGADCTKLHDEGGWSWVQMYAAAGPLHRCSAAVDPAESAEPEGPVDKLMLPVLVGIVLSADFAVLAQRAEPAGHIYQTVLLIADVAAAAASAAGWLSAAVS